MVPLSTSLPPSVGSAIDCRQALPTAPDATFVVENGGASVIKRARGTGLKKIQTGKCSDVKSSGKRVRDWRIRIDIKDSVPHGGGSMPILNSNTS